MKMSMANFTRFASAWMVRTALLVMLWIAQANGQGFVSKTSDVHLNFKGPSIHASIPEITWVTPSIESSYSQENSLDLDVAIRSDVPLRKVQLRLITAMDTLLRPMSLNAGQSSFDLKRKVRLMDGTNVVEVLVENEDGGRVSSARTVLVGKDVALAAVDANRKDYALIFATDKYDHWGELVNPVNDGRTIEGILKEKYGFQAEVVENPTREEILAKLYDYNTRRFNFQDQLFIFFAGHGVFDETLGEGYVVASNSLENDKGKTTYIPHTVLRQNIDNIKCEHILLVMDVCFGGTIDPVLTARRNLDVYAEASDSEYLVKKLSLRTRKFLTSGGKQYVPDGVPGRHSPFAAKLVQALREVGSGKDRILTLPELEVYFQKLTTDPRSGSFGSDNPASDFVFVAKQ